VCKCADAVVNMSSATCTIYSSVLCQLSSAITLGMCVCELVVSAVVDISAIILQVVVA